jgi:hypothetical protein
MDQRRADTSVGGTRETSNMRSNGEAMTAPTPTIRPGDNVRFGIAGKATWHVWAVGDGSAMIATPDGVTRRNAEPLEHLSFVERPNCRCHQQGAVA